MVCMNKYKFFWGGVFSQWWREPFIVNDTIYNCGEQYMMAQKALLFGDTFAHTCIMETRNPKEQKAFGRKVKNFDVTVWNQNKVRIVYEANYAKFSQNENMKGALMATGDKVLVEASPYDRVWGIGMSEDTARLTPAKFWLGENLLGRIITQVREDLKDDILKREKD